MKLSKSDLVPVWLLGLLIVSQVAIRLVPESWIWKVLMIQAGASLVVCVVGLHGDEGES